MGSLQTLPLASDLGVDPEGTEVPFGPLAPGSSVGLNATNASASLDGVTLLATTNVLWLNNTNATGAWYARIDQTSTTLLANLLTLRVGIDNGTTSTDHAVVLLGVLTQDQGAYVRLEPASANRIYLTQLVSNPALTSTMNVDVYVSDDATGANFVVTKAAFSLV